MPLPEHRYDIRAQGAESLALKQPNPEQFYNSERREAHELGPRGYELNRLRLQAYKPSEALNRLGSVDAVVGRKYVVTAPPLDEAYQGRLQLFGK